MRSVRKTKDPHQSAPVADAVPPVAATSVTVAMIQALIPLGLRAVKDALQQEFAALGGARYAHHDGTPGVGRWGAQRGSVYLAEHKVPITVPHVRDVAASIEILLAMYAQLQTPRTADVGLFKRVLGGLFNREYEAAAEAIPKAFGSTISSVSRRFIRASPVAFEQLQTRRHEDHEWLVLLLDDKTFADHQMVIALGVTTASEKRALGLVQTATENNAVCATFLRDFVERSFTAPAGLLVVLDGAKGLRAAVRDVFGDVPVQRCQWHKRENVVRHLPRGQQDAWRRKLQATYAHATYADAKRPLNALVNERTPLNVSAARSLEEGLEETLTLHRLAVSAELGISFKTTNLIKSVMARLEAKTFRVTHWRTSD